MVIIHQPDLKVGFSRVNCPRLVSARLLTQTKYPQTVQRTSGSNLSAESEIKAPTNSVEPHLGHERARHPTGNGVSPRDFLLASPSGRNLYRKGSFVKAEKFFSAAFSLKLRLRVRWRLAHIAAPRRMSRFRRLLR